jgi:hypothetical protein
MASAHPIMEHGAPELSWFELLQIRLAVHELRSSNPKSVLADLGEEKIQALEESHVFRSNVRSMPHDREL